MQVNMRFKLKNRSDNIGTGERKVTQFLWFPKLIGKEWRWLETASYVQIYQFGMWETLRWVDDKERKV
ncbi:hypothetical protein KAMFAM_137 [Bacillus phage Kamfam]|nr:hypothetical protein OTK52_135 [Bacillus phage OTooleKemple52]AXQ67225.1 hypothetical protein KAMFAM_137 [Bacillus phage Kamfam]